MDSIDKNDRYRRQIESKKAFAAGFVGGGKGALEFINLLVNSPIVTINYVCDLKKDAPAIKRAKELNITTFENWKDATKNTVDFVFEITGNLDIQTALVKHFKDSNTFVIPHESAFFMYEIFEEKERSTIELILAAEKKKHDEVSGLNDLLRASEIKLKLINEQLMASESKFRGLIETTSDWVWETDSNVIYTYSSPKIKDLLGYEPEEVVGKSPLDLMPPGEASRLRQPVAEIFENRKPVVTLENVALHKDGREVVLETNALPFYDKNGRFMGYRGIDRDITERRKNEQSYIKLFMQSPLTKTITEIETGKFLEVNDAFLEVFEFESRDEVIGKTITGLNLYTVEQRRKVLGELKSVGTVRDKEVKMTTHTGKALRMLFYIEPIQFGGREVLLTVMNDITQRKRLEEDREKIQKELMLASKLASVGQLAAGIAHEINNPLTINMMMKEHIQEELDEKGIINIKIKEFLAQAEAANIRIENIVRGLRTFARADTEIIEAVNMNTVIESTLSLIESIYKKDNIRFEKLLNSNNAFVKGNTGKLQQVVMNIVSNAKDALKVTTKDKFIRIETFNKINQFILRISDNGPGIPTDIVSRIFDPFFTTKPVGHGTGLGLSISMSIINSFNGTINVETEPGLGTAFIISLPVFVDDNKQLSKSDISKEKRVLKGRLLVVEDEEQIRLSTMDYLSKFGFEVCGAPDGVEGLNKIKTDSFDFVLTDIKMPNMDGLAMLQEAKKIKPNTVYVVFTGGVVTDYSAEQRKLLRELANAYLTKPFTKNQLYEIFQNLIQKTKLELSN